MKRQIYKVSSAGNISRMKCVGDDLPPPGQGEVTIQVKAIGLNFADIFAVLGLYSATPDGAFVPGLEYAGIVVALGEGVTDFVMGDRVMGVTRFGAYATHLNIESEYLRKIPSDWTYAQGAALLVQGLTAYYGLFRLGDMGKGKTVLIHSAAGGVGILANRMVQAMDGYAIGSVGSARKVSFLKEEGCQKVIVRSKNFKAQLQEALDGRPLDLVMECIGGKVLEAGYEALAPMGRMVVYGSAQYGSPGDKPNWLRLAWLYLQRPRIDAQKMIETNRAILGFNLIWLYDRKELMKECLAEMDSMNLPAPHIGHVYPFEDLPDALREFQRGNTIGKVVIEVNDSPEISS